MIVLFEGNDVHTWIQRTHIKNSVTIGFTGINSRSKSIEDYKLSASIYDVRFYYP